MMNPSTSRAGLCPESIEARMGRNARPGLAAGPRATGAPALTAGGALAPALASRAAPGCRRIRPPRLLDSLGAPPAPTGALTGESDDIEFQLSPGHVDAGQPNGHRLANLDTASVGPDQRA